MILPRAAEHWASFCCGVSVVGGDSVVLCSSLGISKLICGSREMDPNDVDLGHVVESRRLTAGLPNVSLTNSSTPSMADTSELAFVSRS